MKLCESDEQYVPLNDGYNWKGDPNATLSGQDIPQLPPGSPPAGPPPAGRHLPPGPAATNRRRPVRPGNGHYVGPDGKVYTQSDLAQDRRS